MNNAAEKFKGTFFSKEFIIFLVIGVINTFNGTIFSYIYSSLLNENIAFAAGYITGLFISYILNSFITFKEVLSFNKFLRFGLSYIPNFIIQNIVVIIVFNIMGLNKLISYILPAIIGIPITFLLLKFYAFNKKR